jgi:hypothetical protein
MRWRTAWVAIALGATGALALTGVAIAASQDHSTGGIRWQTALGGSARAAFEAQDSDPARGHVTVENHDGVSFKGRVDCYHRISDRAASFSGVIESFKGENSPGNLQGTATFVMIVEDGGTPGGAGDEVTLIRGSIPFACRLFNQARQPVTSGNLVVHHD